MRRAFWSFAVLGVAVALFAAPPLFTTASESAWDVASGGKSVGTIILLGDGRSVRAEWSAGKGAPVVFIGTDGKVWVKAAGGDIELAQYKGSIERAIVPALLLPFTTGPKDTAEVKAGKVSSYLYGGAAATYTWDAKGPAAVEVRSGEATYTLTRKTAGKPKSSDPSLYAVNPKRGAGAKLGRLAGNLLGPADKSVSATAGGRGVEKGARFKDGGDYDALEKLETRDEEWAAKLADELEKFQKEGKVGGAQ